MNEKLKTLFDLDQADHGKSHEFGSAEYIAMRQRDFSRREQVRLIVRSGELLDPMDAYHAAWIMNHGDEVADAEMAYRLAERSLIAGYEPAKWLFAASFDRFCMYSGHPQRFGTQIVPDGERYRLWDVDPKTTDQEREEYNVPPIVEMRNRALDDTDRLKQPPIESAPNWLVEAIARWRLLESS